MVEGSILEDLFGTKGSSNGHRKDKELFHTTIVDSVGKVTSSHPPSFSSSITRSHSVDHLPLCVASERQLVVDTIPHSSSSSFHRSMSCAPVDLRQVSSEMPICLLEEDDENDEEIERIITGTTTTPNSTRVTTPTSTRVDTPLEECYETLVECSPSSRSITVTVSPPPLPLSLHSCPSSAIPLQVMTKTKSEKSRPSLKKYHESHKLVTPQTRTILRDFLYKQIVNKQNGDGSGSSSSSSIQPTDSHRPPILITSTVATSNATTNGTITQCSSDVTRTAGSSSCNNSSGLQEMKSSTSLRKLKKRKPIEPHPPLTSYGVFIRENRSNFSGEVLSSQDTAKKLGKMWASLSQTVKQEYTVKSQVDQYRYLRELKEFLSMKFDGVCKKKDISLFVDDTITSTLQHDNTTLSCGLCKLTFCNLFRKQAHFCGRPHSNELLSTLIRLIPQRLLGQGEKNNDTVRLNLNSNGAGDISTLHQETDNNDGDDYNIEEIEEEEEEEEEEGKEKRLHYLIDSYSKSSVCIEECPSDYDDELSTLDEEEERESLCSYSGDDDTIEESVANAVVSVLSSAQHMIDQTEANSHALTAEMTTNQELLDCYCHLLEREYEIKHWSLAYREAIDKCRQEIQEHRSYLQRLLQLIEKCSTSRH